ncbi:MAG: hypothetical protein NTY06_01710 [Candidatus Gottesmanbacteria bacterium]|nr:hypothetical protein [Candidatus Gottesmanbacteria bacterium]
MRKILTSPILWVIILCALPLWALFHPGLPVTHDGIDHVARIANFYQSLKEGNIIPRWAANLNWGYGHPILMFLYPLPSYIASLFHWVGFSFVNSTKIVFGIAMVASGLSMYLWLGDSFGKRAGVIGALLYVFAPYRFVDLYVRGALGEHVAFVFPPLILYFLHKRSFFGTSLSLAALILSHNAIAIMFMPIIGLYMVYLLLFESKQRWLFGIVSIGALLMGFALSAFFWFPAFFEGKYTLRDIVTSGDAVTRFVSWTWFVYSPWNYGGGDSFTKSLGLMQWAGVVFAIAATWKTKFTKVRIILLSSLGILLFSFFIMTSWSKPLWLAVTTLQKFQFPWRFLSVSVFAAAVLGGIALGRSGKLFLILYSFCIILASVAMWHPKAYVVHDESFYSGIYPSTTDTGESSPIWSVRFMEHTAGAPLEVIDGQARITNGFRSSTVHEYLVRVIKPTLFRENTVYFPNWKIYIDGVPTQIQFQNPNYRGLMTFQMVPGNHTVRVVFEDTKIRGYANMISAVTFTFLALAGVGVCIWKKRKFYR